MARKIAVTMAAVLAILALWTGVAGAQASPPTSASVAGEEITRPLVRTGTDAMPEVYVGIGLAAVGIGLVVAARRRKNAHLNPVAS